jgi:transcriptional regulator with XRE-family HTH domain
VDELAESINPEKHALGRRLKGLRESLSWTLGEVSQATKQIDPEKEGVSKVSISRYENGDSFPGYREIKLLAQAFGVSISFVFYGDIPDPYAGWEFSLDEYLKSVIRDVLIDEGLVEGESRSQREHKKTRAMRMLNDRLAPFDPSQLDADDVAEADRLEKAAWQKLEASAAELDKATSKRSLKKKHQ